MKKMKKILTILLAINLGLCSASYAMQDTPQHVPAGQEAGIEDDIDAFLNDLGQNTVALQTQESQELQRLKQENTALKTFTDSLVKLRNVNTESFKAQVRTLAAPVRSNPFAQSMIMILGNDIETRRLNDEKNAVEQQLEIAHKEISSLEIQFNDLLKQYSEINSLKKQTRTQSQSALQEIVDQLEGTRKQLEAKNTRFTFLQNALTQLQ